MLNWSLQDFSCGKLFSGNDLFFVVLRQIKVKGIPSSQSLRLNQKLIYAMELQLGNKATKILTQQVSFKYI